MMRIPSVLVLLTVALSFATAASSAAAPSPAPAGAPPGTPATAELRPKMQAMYQNLAALLTDLFSDERFGASGSAARIEGEIKALTELSHDLKRMEASDKKLDPSLSLIGGMLAEETAEAYRAWKEGRREYARGILRNIPGYCIECHSRNPVGADFARLPLEPTSELKPFERAQFYGATRQFDRSISAFQEAVRGAGKNVRPYDLDTGLRNALSIAVRFKRDPKLAREIVEKSCLNLNCPKFVEENLGAWRRSIVEWEKEGIRKFRTEEALFAEAQRLIKKARGQQSYALDQSALVPYLRASSMLYDLLQAYPQGKRVAEALLLQGMSYEVLSPRRLEDLSSLYYEACIRHAPHTATARQCYRQYESAMLFGYSGSGGTDLPQSVQDKLSQLWTMASADAPVKASPSPR